MYIICKEDKTLHPASLFLSNLRKSPSFGTLERVYQGPTKLYENITKKIVDSCSTQPFMPYISKILKKEIPIHVDRASQCQRLQATFSLILFFLGQLCYLPSRLP